MSIFIHFFPTHFKVNDTFTTKYQTTRHFGKVKFFLRQAVIFFIGQTVLLFKIKHLFTAKLVLD